MMSAGAFPLCCPHSLPFPRLFSLPSPTPVPHLVSSLLHLPLSMPFPHPPFGWEPFWWRGERLCHTRLLMSTISVCHPLWQSQNGRRISRHCASICRICDWLAWWLYCGRRPCKRRRRRRNKKQSRRNDETRFLWWEIDFCCFHWCTNTGTLKCVALLVP